MSELLKIADQCEKSPGPDRELDGKIKLAYAAILFAAGASKDEAVTVLGGDLYAEPLPYTSNTDTALDMLPASLSAILRPPCVAIEDDQAHVEIQRHFIDTDTHEPVASACGYTLPNAVCAAVLRARDCFPVVGSAGTPHD